jgi:hypothetical protein
VVDLAIGDLVDPDPVEPAQAVIIDLIGDDADGDGGDRRHEQRSSR